MRILVLVLALPFLANAQPLETKVWALKEASQAPLSGMLFEVYEALIMPTSSATYGVVSNVGTVIDRESSPMIKGFHSYSVGSNVRDSLPDSFVDEIRDQAHPILKAATDLAAIKFHWMAFDTRSEGRKSLLIPDSDGKVRQYVTAMMEDRNIVERATAFGVLQQDYDRIRPILVEHFGNDLDNIRISHAYELPEATVLESIRQNHRTAIRGKIMAEQPRVRQALEAAGIYGEVVARLDAVKVELDRFVDRGVAKFASVAKAFERPFVGTCEGPIAGKIIAR